MISGIREILDSNKGFLEVETPLMHPILGGAAARPFITHHNTLDMDLYMRIAPELYLKRLIVGGLGKSLRLGRNFRNEGMDTTTQNLPMIEMYQAYADYTDMMDLAEEIITTLAKKVLGTTTVEYNGKTLVLENFKRVHMVDLIKEITGVTSGIRYDF